MKVIILKEDLDKVMPVMARIIVTRGQLPVLGNVLIEAAKNSITFTATNLEIGISLVLGGKVLEEGSITVPARNMAEFVSLVKPGEVILESGGDKLTIVAGKSKAQFAGINASEFPTVPKIEKKDQENKVKMEKKKINTIADQVGYAASVDEARLVLTGIKFYKSQGKLRVVATDGFRLARLDVGPTSPETSKGEYPDNLIIPAKTIAELSKLTSEKGREDIEMLVMSESNQVVFWGENFRLVSRILEGNFPDIDKIIPSEYKTKVIIDRKDLLEAVRTAAIFARENSNIVKFNIQSSMFKVKAVGGQTGEEESELEVETEGDEVEIAFNYKFVLDLLNSMDSDKIVMEANGSQTAVVFKMEGDEGLVGVVMPVRL